GVGEVRREIRADVSAGVRRDDACRRGLRRVGAEEHVWADVYGAGAVDVPGRCEGQDREGVAQGEGRRPRGGGDGRGEGAGVMADRSPVGLATTMPSILFAD